MITERIIGYCSKCHDKIKVETGIIAIEGLHYKSKEHKLLCKRCF